MRSQEKKIKFGEWSCSSVQSINNTGLLWWSVLLKIEDFSDDFSDDLIELSPNWTAEMVGGLAAPRGPMGCRRNLPGFAFVSWVSPGWGPPASRSWPGRRAKHGVNGSWSRDSVGTWAKCDSQLSGNFNRWWRSSSSKALRVVALDWNPFKAGLDEDPSPVPAFADIRRSGVVFGFSWADPELTESSASSRSDFFPAVLPMEFCWHEDSYSNNWPRKLKFGEMLDLFPFTKLQENALRIVFQDDP